PLHWVVVSDQADESKEPRKDTHHECPPDAGDPGGTRLAIPASSSARSLRREGRGSVPVRGRRSGPTKSTASRRPLRVFVLIARSPYHSHRKWSGRESPH